jgi:hypothetical protein
VLAQRAAFWRDENAVLLRDATAERDAARAQVEWFRTAVYIEHGEIAPDLGVVETMGVRLLHEGEEPMPETEWQAMLAAATEPVLQTGGDE